MPNEVEALQAQIKQLTAENAALKSDAQLASHFALSAYITNALRIPPDIVQARFGSHFKVENGKLIARNAANRVIYSRQRPGDEANLDEALEALVDAHPQRERLLKPRDAESSDNNPAPAKASVISRSAFDALTPAKQFEHIDGGGTVADDKPAESQTQRPPKGAMKRTEFDSISHRDRAAFVQGGGRVVD